MTFLTCFSEYYHQVQKPEANSGNIILKQQLVLRQLHRLLQSALFTQCSREFSLSTSLRSFNSCLLLLPRLPVSSICISITRCRSPFMRKMWPIQLTFFLFISCMTFLSSLALYNNYLTFFSHNQSNFSVLLLNYFSKILKLLINVGRKKKLLCRFEADGKDGNKSCVNYSLRWRWETSTS